MKLIDLFNSAKSEFCDLWQYKERGDTLEIITPFSTTTSKFVSVFITYRDKEVVVTDGGWLSANEYETNFIDAEAEFHKIFDYYKAFYKVMVKQSSRLEYYYKKTSRLEMVPALVYDVSSFLSHVISASQIQFFDEKEKEVRTRFGKQATDYLRDIQVRFKGLRLTTNTPIDREKRSIKFNAIFTRDGRMTILSYITGSDPGYFSRSIAKANMDFQVADNTKFGFLINRKIGLIDNSATGYQAEQLVDYLLKLNETTGNHNVLWTERQKIVEYLN